MLDKFYEQLGGTTSVSTIVIVVGMMLLFGFLMTRLTKRLHLPNVTAYLAVGIIMGPFCLNLVPGEIRSGMSFLNDIALAFIAFSIGQFFRLSNLKENGFKTIIIVLIEIGVSSLLIFGVMRYIFKCSIPVSMVFAALAAVTSPTSTMMTIRQKKAQGRFVNNLLEVLALDNLIALLAYSVAISLTVASEATSDITIGTLLKPLGLNMLSIVIGMAFGAILRLMMPKSRTTDNRLIILVAFIFSFCGICAALDVSPLLGCMLMGTVYINISQDDKSFSQLNYFSPPFLLLFYVLSGTKFNLSLLFGSSSNSLGISIMVASLVYCIVRYAGKYGGTVLGGIVTKQNKSVTYYTGLALMPQGGVAIGLAALTLRVIPGEMGSVIQTIILTTSIIYEIIGPALASVALDLSKSTLTIEDITHVETANKSSVEILTERIQAIQKGLPQNTSTNDSYLNYNDEDSFEEAAEEYYNSNGFRGHFRR